MSNHSLVELNHDFRPGGSPDELIPWALAMRTYMGSGDPADLPPGVVFKHIRHHSEPDPASAEPVHDIRWAVEQMIKGSTIYRPSNPLRLIRSDINCLASLTIAEILATDWR